MAKGNRKTQEGPAELLVVEAEEFPTAVIVELWHRNAKGKREFLDSRRYDTVDDAVTEAVTEDGVTVPG
jgi:hypothetical protein